MKTMKFALCAAIVLVCMSSLALAQPTSARHGIGPQAGIGIDPDQFIFGGHAIFGIHGSPIHLGPSLDFGIGDDLTIITLNFDITYDFVIRNSRIVPFAGAGPTLAFISWDDNFGRDDDSETEVGLTILGGVKLPAGNRNFINLSARFGVGDIPDIKLMAGYIFGIGDM